MIWIASSLALAVLVGFQVVGPLLLWDLRDVFSKGEVAGISVAGEAALALVLLQGLKKSQEDTSAFWVLAAFLMCNLGVLMHVLR